MKRTLVMGLALSMAVVAMPRSAAAATAAETYKAKCAMCHGENGKGETTMGKNMKLRDLGSADVQKLSDADLTKVIADGKGKMPAYKGKLADADIEGLVKHIRTFKK